MNWNNVLAQKLSQIEKNKNHIMSHDVFKLPKKQKKYQFFTHVKV
jgi:hypothetical protein